MYVFLSLLCAVCAWELYKNLRLSFKQARMKRLLGAVCKRKGYGVTKLGRGYYLADIRGRSVRIRVLGARSKHSTLCFSVDGTYRFNYLWSIPLRFEQSADLLFGGRARNMPEDADVILLCPVCKTIVLLASDGTTVSLGNGDFVKNVRLYSLSGALRFLERE